MTDTEVRSILRSTSKRLLLPDERGRKMRFPTRQDYIRQLREHGLVADEAEFIADDRLTEAVYLDWLRRSQVGCVFAQLLARPHNRTGMRTVVVRGSLGINDPTELAIDIDRLVNESVNDASNEAVTVLLPQVVEIESLARLVWDISHFSGWTIEKEQPWRPSLVRIGLRVKIGNDVVAEVLGMGPFPFFPNTRQCPISTLEVRTKNFGARTSYVPNSRLASHLAQIPVGHILTTDQISVLSNKFTPALRNRILAGEEDMRAKAGVTYSIPAAIWKATKSPDY